ncbi:hypothetical protein AAFF_G00245020 [Aldrovandia affinis]|uniref:Uncharacterized protein n=1 Tax=Aldrovandia affinis TaxID=143900 RepID=A0AAD7W2X5_9TELE|nr:hypothetical protein AAFF_G00245020 [Aldrovandia affinis]
MGLSEAEEPSYSTVAPGAFTKGQGLKISPMQFPTWWTEPIHSRYRYLALRHGKEGIQAIPRKVPEGPRCSSLDIFAMRLISIHLTQQGPLENGGRNTQVPVARM